MSTTYSTSLRLALMGTGDQSGTWGNTTNTNLGTLLEQSISGVRPISLTGLTTYTLQAYNGTVDDARSMVLVFTGSPSALVTITAPLVNKFYIIVNLCGQTIRMAASGGSTTLDIPYSSSGLTAQCYCDAANATGAGAGFYSAQTGSAGNFTVNGTLTATGVTDTGALSAASLSVSGAATAPTPTVGDNSTKIATTSFVQSALSTVYPVGSIYTSTVSTNPATLFGFGTWVTFGAGRVLLSQDGSTYVAGATGGSADAITVSHTHTASFTGTALGTHQHYVGSHDSTAEYGGGYAQEFVQDYTSTSNGPATYTNPVSAGTPAGSVSVTSTGSSGTGANLQPYVVVYMWNRTA